LNSRRETWNGYGHSGRIRNIVIYMKYIIMNVKLLRFLDKYIMGFFILIFFRLKYFSVSPKKPKKILVIRLWALGSSLLSFPMIRQLEDHFGKDVQYDLLATSRNSGVFKNQ
jgi:hypothetical protein